jgi:hypothetical protein
MKLYLFLVSQINKAGSTSVHTGLFNSGELCTLIIEIYVRLNFRQSLQKLMSV